MTRISASIQPSELCDQMLLAEHREIVRIPNCIISGKAKVEDIPNDFRLGAGHVKFFYDKLYYLYTRYTAIRIECKDRGFSIQDYSDAFHDLPDDLLNDWKPDNTVRSMLVERINERLSTMKVIRYRGEKVELKTMKL